MIREAAVVLTSRGLWMPDPEGGIDRPDETERAAEEAAVRVAIVDPHQLFRECLAGVLAGDPRLEITGRFASRQEALDRLAQSPVDVLLLVLEAPADAVCGFLRDVEERSPQARVMLLGRDEADERILEYLDAGASGFLARDQSLAELRSAIAAVAKGARVCTPRLASIMFARLARLGRERRRCDKLEYLMLPPRQLEILQLIAGGLGNQEIARQLYLSVHTVKNHVHKVLETLGVHSRWAAVQHAIERGWIPDRRRR